MLKNEKHSFLAIGSKDFGYNRVTFLKREYRAKTAFSKAVNDLMNFK